MMVPLSSAAKAVVVMANTMTITSRRLANFFAVFIASFPFILFAETMGIASLLAHQEDVSSPFLRLYWIYNRYMAAAISSAPPVVYMVVPEHPVSGSS